MQSLNISFYIIKNDQRKKLLYYFIKNLGIQKNKGIKIYKYELLLLIMKNLILFENMIK